MDPRKIEDYNHMSLQKLLKLPSLLRDLGNFSNFRKHKWSLILPAALLS